MEEKIKILLAEDDTNLGMLLKEYLRAKGFETVLCEDGEVAYEAFLNQPFDICILDVMMPKKDGFTLAKEIRQINSEIPIIFLTAKNMKEDVLEELLLRIEAVLRRSTGLKPEDEQEIFKIGKLTFNSKKQTLFDGEEEQKLTTKESELLKLLCQNVNKVLERNYALKNIWADDNYFNARSMDVYITKLRKHLKKDPSVEIINVHGKGYKLIL